MTFILDNNVFIYHALLNSIDVPGLKKELLRYRARKVYKCVKNTNPDHFSLLRIEKDCSYNVQENSIQVDFSPIYTAWLKSFGS